MLVQTLSDGDTCDTIRGCLLEAQVVRDFDGYVAFHNDIFGKASIFHLHFVHAVREPADTISFLKWFGHTFANLLNHSCIVTSDKCTICSHPINVLPILVQLSQRSKLDTKRAGPQTVGLRATALVLTSTHLASLALVGLFQRPPGRVP